MLNSFYVWQIVDPPAESTRLDEVTPQNYRSVTPTPSVLEYSVDYPAPLRPLGLQESSIADPEPAEVTVGAHIVTYKIVEDTSIRGRDKLFDSVGYSYTLKRRNCQSTTWRVVNDRRTLTVVPLFANSVTCIYPGHLNTSTNPHLVLKSLPPSSTLPRRWHRKILSSRPVPSLLI